MIAVIVGVILWIAYCEYTTRTGKAHDYNTDPMEGPYMSCRPSCVKCKDYVDGRKISKLEKALR